MLLYGVGGIFLATQTETLAVLRLSDRVSLGLAVAVAAFLTRIGLLAAAWLTGGGLLAVVLAYVAGVVVNGGGMLAAATVSAPRAGMTGLLRSVSARVPPDVIQFQAGVFGKSAIWVLAQNLDAILLAQFTSSADVGLYRGSRQIVDSMRYPFLPLKDAVQPEYSRQWYSGRVTALRRASLRFTLMTFTLAAAGFGLLTIFHQPVTRFILGAEFSGGRPVGADYARRLIRLFQRFPAHHSAGGGGAHLAVRGRGGGRPRGFLCHHRLAGPSIWRGGSGMGQHGILHSLCRGSAPVYNLDTATEPSAMMRTEEEVLTTYGRDAEGTRE